GANFAMVEGVIVLSRLLEKLTLAPEPGHEVRTVSLISLAPAGGLPLRVARRQGHGSSGNRP
ncbi:MAG: cytochrome P450, partial [Pseudomonadota bacterium]